jgi:hypothetical protein
MMIIMTIVIMMMRFAMRWHCVGLHWARISQTQGHPFVMFNKQTLSEFNIADIAMENDGKWTIYR